MRDDFLGFHIAQDFDLREMGLVYYVPASSATLSDALRRLERYSIIGNEGVVLRIYEGDDFVVTFHHVGTDRLSDQHQAEAFLTFLIRLCRQLTNRRLLPLRVNLCHRRKGGCPELNKFLGCNVVFGADRDEFAFPRVAKVTLSPTRLRAIYWKSHLANWLRGTAPVRQSEPMARPWRVIIGKLRMRHPPLQLSSI